MNKTKIALVGMLILALTLTAAGCRVAPRPEPAPSPAPAPNVPGPQTPDMQPVPPPPGQPNVVPPQQPNFNEPGQMPGTPGAPGAPGTGVPNQQQGNQGNVDNRSAERIASMVSDMDDVERAYAVVMGNVALIGVSMEGGNTQNRGRGNNRDNAGQQEREQEISQRVEREMDGINEAIVSTDPEITQRIQNMANEVEQGRPLTGSFGELAEIIRRMAPTTN